MGTLQDLPSGKKFTASAWQKKLKQSTRSGDLKTLQDNQDALNTIAKKREGAIRGGSYDSSRRKSDYREILKSDNALTSRDKGQVREILDHWGTRDIAKKSVASATDVKKAAAKPSRRRDPIDFSSDNDGALSGDLSQAKNKPYGYSPGGSNSAANYFSSSSSSSSDSKSASSYRPPKLLR